MSYQLAYKMEFVHRDGDDVDVEIYRDISVSISPQTIIGTGNPVEINYGDRESEKVPIMVGSLASVNIIQNIFNQYVELSTYNKREYRVDIKKDGSLYWTGYILPSQMTQNFRNPILGLTARCGIGELKEIDYITTLTKPSKNRITMMDFIVDALSQTGLDLDIWVANSYKLTNQDTSTTQLENVFEHQYIEEYEMIDRKYYDILKSVLLGHTIKQEDGVWKIFSPDEAIKTGGNTFYRYDSTGSFLGKTVVSDVFDDVGNENDVTHYLDDPTSMNIMANKTLTTKLEADDRESALINHNFESLADVGWTHYDGASEYYFELAVRDYGDDRFVGYFPYTVSTVTDSTIAKISQDVDLSTLGSGDYLLTFKHKLEAKDPDALGAIKVWMKIYMSGVSGISPNLSGGEMYVDTYKGNLTPSVRFADVGGGNVNLVDYLPVYASVGGASDDTVIEDTVTPDKRGSSGGGKTITLPLRSVPTGVMTIILYAYFPASYTYGTNDKYTASMFGNVVLQKISAATDEPFEVDKENQSSLRTEAFGDYEIPMLFDSYSIFYKFLTDGVITKTSSVTELLPPDGYEVGSNSFDYYNEAIKFLYQSMAGNTIEQIDGSIAAIRGGMFIDDGWKKYIWNGYRDSFSEGIVEGTLIQLLPAEDLANFEERTTGYDKRTINPLDEVRVWK